MSNTFDGFNQLTATERVKAGEQTSIRFVYDGDGLRTQKTVKSSTQVTRYLYDRQYVILETDAEDALSVRYVRGINYISRTGATGDAAAQTSYFLFNGHGDVVQTVSEDGTVENQYDYDIFGNPTLTIEDTYSSAIRYAGEFYDAESGLIYLRARYYNPYTGRFISEDSYWGEDNNPLSLNRYTYVHNEPIRFVDPSGHREIIDNPWETTTYFDGDNRLHIEEFILRDDTELESGYVYDKIIVNDNIKVKISESIYVISLVIGEGTTTSIVNQGVIQKLTTGNDSTTEVNNNTGGSIANIETGTGSTLKLKNNGYVGEIDTGLSSISNIENGSSTETEEDSSESDNSMDISGMIAQINAGKDSKVTITNKADAWINNISSLEEGDLDITNSGEIGTVTRGLFTNVSMVNKEGSYLGADQIALKGGYTNFLISTEQINLSYDQAIGILRQIVRNGATRNGDASLTTEQLKSLGWSKEEADGMRDFLLAMYRAAFIGDTVVSGNEKEQGKLADMLMVFPMQAMMRRSHDYTAEPKEELTKPNGGIVKGTGNAGSVVTPKTIISPEMEAKILEDNERLQKMS